MTSRSHQRHPRSCRQDMTTSRMNYSQAKFRIIITLYWVLSVTDAEVIFRVDPLALLSATLRTYQKAACDTDQVVIACPRGTSISIEFAQYNKFIAKDGISIDELCRANSDVAQGRAKAKHLLRGSTFGSQTQKVLATRYANNAYGLHNIAAELTSTSTSASASASAGADIVSGAAISTDGQSAQGVEFSAPDSCMWPNALQYSLLQTVVEACQKKKHCKFNGASQYYGLGASGVGDTSGTSSYYSSTTSSGAISVDPCPKRRKIVEVAYKCRPYEFRSKVACHNDVAQLECNPYSRIAVYSASFGRTEYESIQCPQPQGVREETCLASYATETVMQICHGRRRCNLAADANTFGSPCQPNSRMYLKVVYTCVPKQVLKERYESEVEADEPEDFEGDMNELYDDDLIYKESEAIPKLYSNTTAAAPQSPINVTATNTGAIFGTTGITVGNSSLLFETETGGVNPVMTHSADLSLEDDQERLYLYLLIAGFAGVIFCIVIVAVRVVVQKRDGSATGADTNSTSSAKAGVGAGGADGETAIPHGFNDTISEIDADIDLTTPIPVPSVSRNENYTIYGPATSLYGSHGPHSIAHNASTLLLQGSATGVGAPGLIENPLICGPRQSPDVIGTSSNTFVAGGAGGASANCGVGQEQTIAMGGLLAPTIMIGSCTAVVSASPMNCSSSAIGTAVPISSLTQYTTAPTFRAGYIIHPDGVIQRPTSTPSPPLSTSSAPTCLSQQSQLQHQQQQQQRQPQPPQPPTTMTTISPSSQMSSTSTLRRSKHSMSPPSGIQQQSSYDGTAPRTLSTGVPVNSQFYYG